MPRALRSRRTSERGEQAAETAARDSSRTFHAVRTQLSSHRGPVLILKAGRLRMPVAGIVDRPGGQGGDTRRGNGSALHAMSWRLILPCRITRGGPSTKFA
jgi:hypothetical protein